MPDYKSYIRQRIEILNKEVKLIKPLITAHPSTIGAFYETILKKFFQDFIPNTYKISTGFIMDIENNNMSRQIDILVFQGDDFPPIYQHENVVIVESSTVYAAIEVKADINLESIQIAKENMESVKAITYPITDWYLIGINSKSKMGTILNHKKEYLRNCTGLLVLDKYYVEGDKVFPNDKEDPPATEVFLNNFLYRLIHPTKRPKPKIIEYK